MFPGTMGSAVIDLDLWGSNSSYSVFGLSVGAVIDLDLWGSNSSLS